MSEEQRMIRKMTIGEIKTYSDKREIDAVVSEEEYDRDEEKLIVGTNDYDGITIAQYKKNPVLMWAHDYRSPPIGTCLAIEKHGKQLMAKFKFTDKTARAREVFSLYQEKTLRAFSIGFIPVKDKYDKEKKIYNSVELLEVSAVPIPSNRPALALGVKNGTITDEGIMKAAITLDTHTFQQYDPIGMMSPEEIEVLAEKMSDQALLELLQEGKLDPYLQEMALKAYDKYSGKVR